MIISGVGTKSSEPVCVCHLPPDLLTEVLLASDNPLTRSVCKHWAKTVTTAEMFASHLARALCEKQDPNPDAMQLATLKVSLHHQWGRMDPRAATLWASGSDWTEWTDERPLGFKEPPPQWMQNHERIVSVQSALTWAAHNGFMHAVDYMLDLWMYRRAPGGTSQALYWRKSLCKEVIGTLKYDKNKKCTSGNAWEAIKKAGMV